MLGNPAILRSLNVLALVVSTAAPTLASAQRRSEREPEYERAVLLFEESEQLYNQGDFEGAATLLRRAYDLHREPMLLYNLGRSLEAMGDLDEAIGTYERYLVEAPEADDRGEVEAQLVTLRARRDQLAEEEHRVVPAPVPSEREGSRVSPWPFVVLGAGAAIVGGGVVFGVLGSGLHDDATTERVQVEAARLEEEAGDFATIANVFFAAGAAVVVGGVVFLVLELALGDSGEDAALEDASRGIVARF